MTTAGRRGFTLVELLVVVVLGGLMILAIYQVLITNTRVYAANNAQVQGQQSLRAGLDVLFSELREVSAEEGDIIGMGPDSVTIRASRAFGLVCATDYASSPPSVTAFRVGPMVQPPGGNVRVPEIGGHYPSAVDIEDHRLFSLIGLSLGRLGLRGLGSLTAQDTHHGRASTRDNPSRSSY